MIKELEINNPKVAEEIVALQKASYRIEADIIGFDLIPPLLETVEDIYESKEVYIGYYEDSVLAGIISYIVENDVLDIYKVAVHPSFFKRGIATKLLQYVEQVQGIDRITVSTGLKNTPAVNLYTQMGYKELQRCEVEKGVHIVSFEKVLN